ncbi:hypothetical protein OEG84_09030 [Hoeflea sp. G2-23]|uniref:Uncharacterized protein n=1 Tax=Hoeflea algicola TaxID=2983763 RepID=A0ABT3Z7V0_9HYPH|nr:hypothetical protein [Hoeflea algicola]MCY0147852.1 hypothetical protein [Hoeflea algicola]
MIVGTQFFTAPRVTTERAILTNASAAVTPESVEAGDEALDSLALLDNFVESAALGRKAFAEDRLKHLKEQMNTLSLFNLAPGFLAGHTARMAKELESAASDFASAFKTLAGLEQPANPGTATDGSVPTAYLEVMDDDAPLTARMSPEDAETAASFMNTAYQLRGVVELISDDARDSANMRRSADSARNTTDHVMTIMARLEGPSVFNKTFW